MMLSKLLPMAFVAACCFGQDVQSVYILRMGNGLDQYLANHLTREKLMRVVTDPKLADFILTDRLGDTFQAKYDELYPVEKPKVEKPKVEKPPRESRGGWGTFALKLPVTERDAFHAATGSAGASRFARIVLNAFANGSTTEFENALAEAKKLQ